MELPRPAFSRLRASDVHPSPASRHVRARRLTGRLRPRREPAAIGAVVRRRGPGGRAPVPADRIADAASPWRALPLHADVQPLRGRGLAHAWIPGRGVADAEACREMRAVDEGGREIDHHLDRRPSRSPTARGDSRRYRGALRGAPGNIRLTPAAQRSTVNGQRLTVNGERSTNRTRTSSCSSTHSV